MNYGSALVTGASGGIGQAIVTSLRDAGMHVHAVSRNATILEELAKQTGCIVHAIDITDADAITALLSTLSIELLVNNAGAGTGGTLVTNTSDEVDTQVDVNIRAILQLIRLVLPGMIERDHGHIVNIGSIAAHYNFGGNAVYHATKAAVHMLSRQLRYDLFGKHIRITEVTPGRVQTGLFAKSLGIDPEAARREFFDGYESLQPIDVANAVLFAVAAPPHVNISHIEIMPTMQVTGGIRISKSATS